jgi:hypothetical protein
LDAFINHLGHQKRLQQLQNKLDEHQNDRDRGSRPVIPQIEKNLSQCAGTS